MGSVLDKNSSLTRKRIEKHSFEDENGEEYEASKFHGFGDYFRRKRVKLQNLDAETRAKSEKPPLFKGIVAHITGYTQPSLHVLHREIVQHGGGFLQYLDSKTMATHIVASSLPPKKTVDFSRYRIVKPAWIMDSVQAGKLLPWMDYRVLDEGPRQKVLKLEADKGLSPAIPKARRGYREQTDGSFYTNQLKVATATLTSQNLSQMAEKNKTPRKSQTTGQTICLSDTPISPAGRIGDIASDKVDSVPTPKAGPTPVSKPVPLSMPSLEPPKNMTSEEHNSWLLSDPRLRKSSTANPDFLKQFYSESRLHHLSTWKAELKSSLHRLAAEKSLPQKKPRRRPGERTYIMHVDFDSFFCAVSLKRHPEFAKHPSVVAHGPGPGSEIASCNYPARKLGIKNGIWMKRALELCSDLKVLPYDFPAYKEASRRFYESILSVGGVVQSVSVDEALIDVTSLVVSKSGSQGMEAEEDGVSRERERAEEIAYSLREQIQAGTGCAVSIGIGSNILQAKIALKRAKPAGQFLLKSENVLDIIGELQVEELPGVSYSIGGKLEELGIRRVKDIRGVPRERLVSTLGPKTGEKLADYSRGIDRTEVGEQPARKSISAEVNWGIRFINQPEAEEFVFNLCKELEKRMISEQSKGKHLTMKIIRRCLDAPLDPAKHLGHGKCDTLSKSTTFGVATHNCEVIGREAVSILRSFKFSPGDLRGLGVQMTKLETVKVIASGPESSQHRLSFKTFGGAWSAKKQPTREPIHDAESPRRGRSPHDDIDQDPIADDPLTPRKPRVHPAMTLSRAGRDDAKANMPLNVSGNQFILPSNADPAVLVELPFDIRNRLTMGQPLSDSSPTKPLARAKSPDAADKIPSQVDAEIFNALLDDVKAEVLTAYGGKPAQPRQRSTHRNDPLAPLKKQTTPTKRGGIRGWVGKAQRPREARTGFVQEKNSRAIKQSHEEPPALEDVDELDAAFLAELPEDVRNEVVADHRRRRLARRPGLDPLALKNRIPDVDRGLESGQRCIQFPASPRKVPFAGLGVASMRETKDMLDTWHSETRGEGPHGEDVLVLTKFLAQVVVEERDLEKAASLVTWLQLLVEQDTGNGSGRESWQKAMDQITGAVQEAVRQRGLAPLNI